jgi:hypothetical protein
VISSARCGSLGRSASPGRGRLVSGREDVSDVCRADPARAGLPFDGGPLRGERGLPEAERGFPPSERGLPPSERGLPGDEGRPGPLVDDPDERGLPEAERALPDSERGLPEAERGLPDDDPPPLDEGLPEPPLGRSPLLAEDITLDPLRHAC